MNATKKQIIGGVAVIALAVGLLVRYGAVASSYLATPTVTVNNPAAQTVTFNVNGTVSSGAPSDSGEVLGGMIHNSQEYFDGGVAVTDLSVSGLATGNVMSKIVSYMSSAATTTACSVLNSSGYTRIITGAGVVDKGTSASTGAILWSAGTSTQYGAVSSFYTKVLNGASLTRAASIDVISTTSSVLGTSGAYVPWGTGEYFNFISSTTTNAGRCYVSYYSGL